MEQTTGHFSQVVAGANTRYATVAEIDRAMPFNRPPVIDAGDDLRTDRQKVALPMFPAGQLALRADRR